MIDKDTQQAILAECKKISLDLNPKIWLGIKWLCTYISIRPGQPFGEKYLYKWWKKACENLGVEGVDLYGGTRHSSVTALKDVLSPEQIKTGTMHSTNKAFERYFQRNSQDAIEVYSLAAPAHDRPTKKVSEKLISYRN